MGRWIVPAALLVAGALGFVGWLAGAGFRPPHVTWLGGHHGASHFASVTPLESIDVRFRGGIELAGDERSILGMAEGARLEIGHRDGLNRRRLVASPSGDGTVRYEYELKGRKREFDEAGRAWLSELLPRIARESGIDAEARLARILEREGVAGVLHEIARTRSGSAVSRYCHGLREQTVLDPAELAELVRQCSGSIASSGDRATFLIDAAGDCLRETAATEAFFDGTETIPSSGDRARVLTHALEEAGPLTDPGLARLLRSASSIASSGDKASVLTRAVPRFVENEAVRDAFFDAAGSIPSSGDRSSVLIALLARDDLDRETVRRVLRSASAIASSGDRTRVLLSAARRVAGDEALVATYIEAADGIPSSGDRERARSAVRR